MTQPLKILSLKNSTQQYLKAFLLFFVCFAPSSWAIDDIDEARALLQKMVRANRELAYQGMFTYEYAGALKSFRIQRMVKDGGEYEKLLYLNGPYKEVVRKNKLSDCQQVTDKFFLGHGIDTELSAALDRNYEFHLRGEDRVADRSARVIHLVPKDDLRYGYVFSIDKGTNLLLQSLLIDHRRHVLERFQFVDVDFMPDDVQIADVIDSSQVKSVPATSVNTHCPPPSIPDNWRATWLPGGFQLVGGERDSQGLVTLIYTDGLAHFSIFIDPRGIVDLPDIQAQRGATVAQFTRKKFRGVEYAICVVGEVPMVTAQKIAEFVSPE